jgi:hypothetical protein
MKRVYIWYILAKTYSLTPDPTPSYAMEEGCWKYMSMKFGRKNMKTGREKGRECERKKVEN